MRSVLAAATAFALLCPSSAGAGGTSTTTPAKPTTQAAAQDQQQERAERHKMDLEIEKLEADTSFEGRLRPWIPLASVAVAFGVAYQGTRRYRGDLRRAREIRIDDQVSREITALMDAHKQTGTGSARAVSALRHLTALTAEPEAKPSHAARVTQATWSLIQDDAVVLDTPELARLPMVVLEEWEPYAQRLRKEPAAAWRILERYRAQLRRLHQFHAVYVASLREGPHGLQSAEPAPPEDDQRLLERVVEAYVGHVDVLRPEDHAAAVANFKEVTNNRELTEQLFPQES